MMQQTMKELGFSPAERGQIQKQLLCLACAPSAPLGISKSTLISFASRQDESLQADFANNFILSKWSGFISRAFSTYC